MTKNWPCEKSKCVKRVRTSLCILIHPADFPISRWLGLDYKTARIDVTNELLQTKLVSLKLTSPANFKYRHTSVRLVAFKGRCIPLDEQRASRERAAGRKTPDEMEGRMRPLSRPDKRSGQRSQSTFANLLVVVCNLPLALGTF